MNKAWCLYYDGNDHRFEELDCIGKLESTDPTDFGLPEGCSILLVFQQAQFVDAWLNGVIVRRW